MLHKWNVILLPLWQPHNSYKHLCDTILCRAAENVPIKIIVAVNSSFTHFFHLCVCVCVFVMFSSSHRLTTAGVTVRPLSCKKAISPTEEKNDKWATTCREMLQQPDTCCCCCLPNDCRMKKKSVFIFKIQDHHYLFVLRRAAIATRQWQRETKNEQKKNRNMICLYGELLWAQRFYSPPFILFSHVLLLSRRIWRWDAFCRHIGAYLSVCAYISIYKISLRNRFSNIRPCMKCWTVYDSM